MMAGLASKQRSPRSVSPASSGSHLCNPGSNGPWWSLGYEAWYYAIFALMFFTNGRKRWLFAGAAMLVAGPKIWLLMPSWLMGVWVWRQIKLGEPANFSRAVALALTLVPLCIYVLAHQALLHLHLLSLDKNHSGRRSCPSVAIL